MGGGGGGLSLIHDSFRSVLLFLPESFGWESERVVRISKMCASVIGI